MKSLKSELLRLLKEDEEFRYAVAGLIGLEEILKRLEEHDRNCLLYTSPSPRDRTRSRMPSSA